MLQIDFTTAVVESNANIEEELSVDTVAQIQEFQIATGNGTSTNGVGAVAEPPVPEIASLPVQPPLPKPPLPPLPKPPLLKRKISGRYRSTGRGYQVELRCDVDGRHPLRLVSADYYSVTGTTVQYQGSMRVDAPTISVTNTQVTITGVGSYTWQAGAPRVKVTIPRTTVFQPPAPATLQHLSLNGVPGATFVCAFESSSFRTVLLEQDRQDTVGTPFVSYNTGALPSGGAGRVLTVPAAYAEAGIEMQTSGIPDIVNTSEAGSDAAWSNAELHAAMEQHFSLWKDLPQWAVWLFHAQKHDLGSGLLGIMFDQEGRQRQGAAVFYEGMAGSSSDRLRLQLFVCTHELGHCFNLYHSWIKSYTTPPGVNRPGALSWMNYPWRYPGGEAAFWNAFPFQFDDPELIHLHHAFRDAIIMGGNNFGIGAALEVPEGWRDPIQDESGLKLELQAPARFPFGAPVSVELRLSLTDTRGKHVHSSLKPASGIVEIAIRNPDNTYRVLRPLIQHCLADNPVMLSIDQPTLSEGAFIGYGRDGFYFDRPGFYQVRARYHALDGSVVLSNVQRIEIQRSLTSVDDEMAGLFFDDQVGVLCSLVGSDYEGLKRGNTALTQVREQYPSHPLAIYARLIQGVNSAREFKSFGPDKYVRVRKADPEEANRLLEPIVDMSRIPTTTAEMRAGTPEYMLTTTRSLLKQAAERQLAPDLRSYLQARKREIATEIAGIVS